MADYLFISGMGRSGTTLLDKMLCNHPQVSVLSQPFPLLFVEAKRDFLATIGCPDAVNPLGHYFMEAFPHTIEDVQAFLSRYDLSTAQIRSLFDAMKEYNGQYHKPSDLDERLAVVAGGPFGDVVKRLLYALRHRDDARIYGSKETHCEEFWPFFLDCGFKCLAIIRAPRDVVVSFNFGRGSQFGGKARPTLFYVRNWRKSIAFALQLAQHPGFLWIRYEDLMRNTEAVLRRIGAFLDIEKLPQVVANNLLVDQSETPWKSNSSFGSSLGLDHSTIGRFKDYLPDDTTAYIETACYPEMRALGYALNLVEQFDAAVLKNYQEPFEVTHDNFLSEQNYSSDPKRIADECQRIALLLEEPPSLSPEAIRRWYIQPKAFLRLRRAMQ